VSRSIIDKTTPRIGSIHIQLLPESMESDSNGTFFVPENKTLEKQSPSKTLAESSARLRPVVSLASIVQGSSQHQAMNLLEPASRPETFAHHPDGEYRRPQELRPPMDDRVIEEGAASTQDEVQRIEPPVSIHDRPSDRAFPMFSEREEGSRPSSSPFSGDSAEFDRRFTPTPLGASPLTSLSACVLEQEYDRDTWRMYNRIHNARVAASMRNGVSKSSGPSHFASQPSQLGQSVEQLASTVQDVSAIVDPDNDFSEDNDMVFELDL